MFAVHTDGRIASEVFVLYQ